MGWCRRDPIVKIGDLTVDIVLSSYFDMNEHATGPTQLVITVPPGIPTRFVADDPGFGRHGYDVRFIESSDLNVDDCFVDVQVKAYTPAANPPEGPLPILLNVTPLGDGRPASGEIEGLANEWVILHATLAADESDDTPPTDARDKKAREKGKKVRGKKKSW